jgi:hypothetical protein
MPSGQRRRWMIVHKHPSCYRIHPALLQLLSMVPIALQETAINEETQKICF